MFFGKFTKNLKFYFFFKCTKNSKFFTKNSTFLKIFLKILIFRNSTKILNARPKVLYF